MKKKKPELITVQVAAERKGVTDARVYQWIKEGRLTKYEQFGRVLIDASEIEALQAQRRGPKPSKI
jgi:excisionase family DNA binding protein